MLTLSGTPPAGSTRSAPRGAGWAHALLLALVLALQFSPAIGLLGFGWTDDPQWALNGALRDMAVGLLVLLALATQAGRGAADGGAWPASVRWALATVAVYALFALASGTHPLVLALNLRRLALMPLLFLAVRLIPWTPVQVDRSFAWIVGSSALVALLGVAERLAPDTLWTDVLDIGRYTAANGLDRFGKLDFHDSGRFFSWDLEPWTGVPLRRMVSTYLEPTTLAAGMATLLVLAQARQARGHAAGGLVLLAGVCGLATLSKGFVLFLLVLMAWRLLGWPSPRQVLALGLGGSALALSAAALHLDGPLAHVAGLASSLQYLADGHWLGEGLGNAGNYTQSGADVGEESGLGNTIGQLGLAGLLPLLWVSAIARDVLRAATARRDPGGPWLAAWLLFWMLSYLLSASSLGVGGNALGFIALALYLHPASGARGP